VSNLKGLTLVEVMVTGTLFAVVLSMIAQALVVGSRSQRQLSHKIAVHRQASMALDALVRDAEMARYNANVRLIVGAVAGPVPATDADADADIFTEVQNAPAPPTELQFTRMEPGATLYDPPRQIKVGYYRNTTDDTLRQVYYESDGTTIVSGTPPDGKVLVRDVRDFDVKLVISAVTNLPVLTARIQVATINEHVVTEVTLE
jgi:type II secretory pathway pseudopilin PulG